MLTKVYQTKEGEKNQKKIHDLIRTAYLKRTFSKGDSTNWMYKLSKITKFVNDTTPSDRLDKIPESIKEALVK